jgi:hypothetical protein
MPSPFALPILLAGAAIAAEPCAPCHPAQVNGYLKTGMARSLSRPSGRPTGRVTHALSGSVFTVRATASGILQTLERGGYKGNHTVAYVIGSGNHAFGYLVNIAGYLFQSPLSFYSRAKVWDLAPGYERDASPDFTRPVTQECLWCHAGRPQPVEGSLNKYQSPAFAAEAISCDRCHGPAAEHVKRPSANNILNPKKLPSRARAGVCEQCHLGGEARIPNPGRTIGEFEPGMQLEEVFSVFVFDRSVPGLKVVSHVEQLALSACAQKSGGELWCGTCHNPHDATPAAAHTARCRECHTGALPASHPGDPACARCHMPKRPARDGGHTAFTDHWIQRRAAANPDATTGVRRLVAWAGASGALGRRNLGLANVTVGERDHSAQHLDEGYRLLTEVHSASQKDPAVLTSLGLLLLRKSRPKEALAMYESALAIEPAYAPYHVNVATAATQAGDESKAITHLERAIDLDPSLEQAYRKLGELYDKRGDRARARQALGRYLKFMPGNLAAQAAIDVLR